MALLRWWFMFCSSTAAAIGAAWFGLFGALWHADQTKLSFLTIGLYSLATLFVGWMTARAARGYDVSEHTELVEEACDLLMKVAIMGTTMGFFLIARDAFAGGAITAASMAEASKGFSTICMVTFVGVLCNSLLKLQAVNLGYLLRDFEG